MATTSGLLNNKEAAAYLGYTPQTLRAMRSTGDIKIRYLKVGAKVFYRKEDLDEFLNSCVVEPA